MRGQGGEGGRRNGIQREAESPPNLLKRPLTLPGGSIVGLGNEKKKQISLALRMTNRVPYNYSQCLFHFL